MCKVYYSVVCNGLDLDHVVRAFNKLRDHHSEGKYIWQEEAPELLELPYPVDNVLSGCTQYDDNLDDLWAIVFLLFSLSSKFPGLWINVKDDCGETLLIEAAHYLPDWLQYRTGEIRSWIHDDHVYIIPASVRGKRVSRLNESRAFEIVVKQPEVLTLMPAITRCIKKRLEKYPKNFVLHRARATLDRRFAGFLHEYPNYLPRAVSQLCSVGFEGTLDRQSRDLLNPKSVDPVTISVEMNRMTYIKLLAYPPVPRDVLESDPLVLGEKITKAILFFLQGLKKKKPLDPCQVEKDDEFKKFRYDYTRKGYLRGELPNSTKAKELSQKATRYFYGLKNCLYGHNFSCQAVERFKTICLPSDSQIALWDHSTDPCDWMCLDENKFKDMTSSINFDQDSSDESSNDITDHMDKFMEQETSLLNDDSLSRESDYEDDESDGGERFSNIERTIDEDDFLEFFLKDALKLDPEEIESYRAFQAQNEVSEEESSDEDLLEKELQDYGIIDPEHGQIDPKAIADLLQSFQEGDASGPAATILELLQAQHASTKKSKTKPKT